MVVHTTNYRGRSVSYSAAEYDNLQNLRGAARKYYEERLDLEWNKHNSSHEHNYGHNCNWPTAACYGPDGSFILHGGTIENKYIENVGWFSKRTVFASKKFWVETLTYSPSAKPMAAIADQTYLVKYNNGEITDRIWLTDYLKCEKSTQPYRETDSYVIAWPDNREITQLTDKCLAKWPDGKEIPQRISAANIGRYQLTNFERTFFLQIDWLQCDGISGILQCESLVHGIVLQTMRKCCVYLT